MDTYAQIVYTCGKTLKIPYRLSPKRIIDRILGNDPHIFQLVASTFYVKNDYEEVDYPYNAQASTLSGRHIYGNAVII
jgi:hypothetical protein